MRIALLVIIFLLLLYVVYNGALFNSRVKKGQDLATHAVAYSQSPPSIDKKILMIGDSTVVGTGASKSEESVAGKIGAAYPNMQIVNKGVNGAQTKNVLDAIKLVEETDYDIILIHVGGNDVVKLANLDESGHQAESLLDEAEKRGTHVFLLTGGSIGFAPIIPFPVNLFYNKRSLALRALFKAAVKKHERSTYIDLYRPKKDDPFSIDPARYYAADGFHPSSDGYEIWYREIKKAFSENGL